MVLAQKVLAQKVLAQKVLVAEAMSLVVQQWGILGTGDFPHQCRTLNRFFLSTVCCPFHHHSNFASQPILQRYRLAPMVLAQKVLAQKVLVAEAMLLVVQQ